MIVASPLGQDISAQEIANELRARGFIRRVPAPPPLTLLPATPPVEELLIPVVTPTFPIPEIPVIPVVPPIVPVIPIPSPEVIPPKEPTPPPAPKVLDPRSAVKEAVRQARTMIDSTKMTTRMMAGNRYYMILDPNEYDRILGIAFQGALQLFYNWGGDPQQYGSKHWGDLIRAELTAQNILRSASPIPPVKAVTTPPVVPVVPPVVPVVPEVVPVVPEVVPVVPEREIVIVPEVLPITIPETVYVPIEPVMPTVPIPELPKVKIEPIIVPEPDVIVPEIIPEIIPEFIPEIIPEILPIIQREPYIPRYEPITPVPIVEEKKPSIMLILGLVGVGLAILMGGEPEAKKRKRKEGINEL